MVRYVWWSEHLRLCASGKLTTVRGHFKGLDDCPIEVRTRYRFATKIAKTGFAKNMPYYRPRSECPQCGQNTKYFTDKEKNHAWFDTINPDKWRTHTCMSIRDTKCSPEWMNSPEALAEQKQLEEQKKINQQEMEATRRRKNFIMEQKNKLSSIQQACGVKTNALCLTCNSRIYSFRTSTGLKKLYDSLYPFWQVHECLLLEDDARANPKKPVKSKSIVTPTFKTTPGRRRLILGNGRRLGLKLRKRPPEIIENTDVNESERQYVLCRLMRATTYQNGYRLRLNPVPLPKVDMVVFCEVNAIDIEGVSFVYLNDRDMSFLSQNTLEPVQATVDYVTIRMM